MLRCCIAPPAFLILRASDIWPPAPCADRGGHGQLWARSQYPPPGRSLAFDGRRKVSTECSGGRDHPALRRDVRVDRPRPMPATSARPEPRERIGCLYSVVRVCLSPLLFLVFWYARTSIPKSSSGPSTRPHSPPSIGGAQTFALRNYPQTWPTCPLTGLASQPPIWWFLCISRRNSSMQAWWAAGSVMLTQGSPGASAMAAAADTPNIAFLIISFFSDPLMAALLSPPTQCRTLWTLPTATRRAT